MQVERVVDADAVGLRDRPLACSMTIRLFSAPCSCSVRTSPRRMARSCSSADRGDVGQRLHDLDVGVVEVAARSVPKTLIAPITSLRSRSGNACTERKPTAVACGANSGQRSPASLQVGVDDRFAGAERVQAGTLLVLQLEQLQQLDVLVRGGHELQPARLVGEQQTRRRTRSTRPAVRSVSICRNSIRSNSSTRVSATSTKIVASRCCGNSGHVNLPAFRVVVR